MAHNNTHVPGLEEYSMKTKLTPTERLRIQQYCSREGLKLWEFAQLAIRAFLRAKAPG